MNPRECVCAPEQIAVKRRTNWVSQMRPGTITQHGEYQVIRRLGEGSMGAVYLAEHSVYGYRVALKRLHAHLSQYEELVLRFLAEAEAAARIRHPGMVDVFESGIDDRGSPYLVMD